MVSLLVSLISLIDYVDKVGCAPQGLTWDCTETCKVRNIFLLTINSKIDIKT